MLVTKNTLGSWNLVQNDLTKFNSKLLKKLLSRIFNSATQLYISFLSLTLPILCHRFVKFIYAKIFEPSLATKWVLYNPLF